MLRGMVEVARGGEPAADERRVVVAVLVAVGISTFLTSLDNTVVNVALPSVAASLGASLSGLEWVSASYLLGFGALLMVGGTLADRLGRKRTLQGGLALFALTSAVGAVAQDVLTLVLARLAQGVSAAFVVPATLAVVAADLHGRRRQAAGAVWAAAVAVAFALGPVVGGLVSEHASWRWLFLGNVPLVLVVMAAARALPERTLRETHARGLDVDVAGLLTSTGSVASLTPALIISADGGLADPLVLALVGAAVGLGALFAVVERRAVRPLVELALYRNRVFVGGTLAQVLWGCGIGGVFFVTALYLQQTVGYSPGTAGLAFLPLAGALLVVVPFAGPVARARGMMPTVVSGLLVVAVGLLLATRFGPHDPYVALLPALLLIGVGSALTTPVMAHVLAVVPAAQAGAASGLMTAAREITGALGIALSAAVLAVRSDALLGQGADVATAAQGGFALALVVAALVLVVAAVVAALSLRTPPVLPAGSQESLA